jgi:hypothetical protein
LRPVERILEHLEGVENHNGFYRAFCPAHDDRNTPNLDVKEGENCRALVICRAGCSQERILDALEERGLDRRELFSPSANGHPRNGHKRRRAWQIRDASGNLQAEHVRYDKPDGGKDCFWRLPGATRWGLKGRKLSTLPLYGSDRAREWPEETPLVIVAEGEPATDALLGAGFAAVGTVTGASGTPESEPLEVLRGRRVILWPDADEEGRRHMERIADRLQGIAGEVRIFEWTAAPEKGDAADHPAVLSRSRKGVGELLDAMAAAPVWQGTVEPVKKSALSFRTAKEVAEMTPEEVRG